MDDRRRLTAAVEQEIQSKWVSVMAGSTRELPETSEQVLAYLRSRESQHTSDYIIRRHIQNCFPQFLEEAEKVSGEKYVDLNRNKNIAWEPDFNQALSECLYKRSSEVISKALDNKLLKGISRKPKAISRDQWLEYLTNHKRIQRKQLFKVALTLGMDIETTQKLLIACGKEPYNLHSAHDVICWYCQHKHKNEAYEAFLRLNEEYEDRVKLKGNKEEETRVQGAKGQEGENKERVEKGQEEEAGKQESKVQESGITTFIHHLIDEAADDRIFLDELVRNSDELTEYSKVQWSEYLRFACYLAIVYPEYTYSYVESREKGLSTEGWILQKEEKTVPVSYQEKEVVVSGREDTKGHIEVRKIPNMNQLLTAMFQDSFWFSGNKAHGKKEKHIAKVQKDAGGLVQTFCNNYKERCMKILKQETGIDRQDILLFSFFFISNYLYLSSAQRSLVREKFGEIGADGTELDQAVQDVMDILEDDANYEEEAFETVMKCMNLLLRSYGFVEVYLPNPFDRFVVLALLSDAPLAVTSVILESIKNDREDGVFVENGRGRRC